MQSEQPRPEKDLRQTMRYRGFLNTDRCARGHLRTPHVQFCSECITQSITLNPAYAALGTQPDGPFWRAPLWEYYVNEPVARHVIELAGRAKA